MRTSLAHCKEVRDSFSVSQAEDPTQANSRGFFTEEREGPEERETLTGSLRQKRGVNTLTRAQSNRYASKG